MVAALIYSVFAGWQLYEIHSGAKDTHDLAVAAGKQADATKQLATEAKRAADLAQEQQTAWVGIEEASNIMARPEYTWSPALPYPTIWIDTRFRVKNYGPSPAFREQETVNFASVLSEGEKQPIPLKKACNIDAYRTPGGVTLQGDIGEMILPTATKNSSVSWGMPNAQQTKDLLGVWITVCILYQDGRDQWHYSGYRYISTSGVTPTTFPGHPGWSYVPFDKAILMAASAE
jgi:hypothetical protein